MGKCPGQAKFEGYLPNGLGGIQIFFEPCIPRCCEVDSEILGTPFATIFHYSQLFSIIRTIRDFALLALFAIRYSDYSLFAICDFTIRYSGFPDTPVEYTAFISGHLVHFRFSYVKPNHIMITPLKDSVVWRVQVTNNMNP